MMGRVQVWFGVLCVIASMAGMMIVVASFDRNETRRTMDSPAPRWTADPDGHARFALGRFSLPSPGSMRVVACPTPLADPHATLRVNFVGANAASAVNEALTEDESRGKRCFDASFRTDRAGMVIAEIIVNGVASR